MAETIEPVRRTIEVTRSPARAFMAFMEEMTAWWPLASHSMSAQDEKAPARSVDFTADEGGLIEDVAASGRRPAGEPGRP